MRKEDVIFIYGDVMFCLAWNRMLDFHERKEGRITVLVHPNSHPFDSDLLIMNKNNCVTGIDLKTSERDRWYENCVNAGIHILSNSVIQDIDKPDKLDFERDVLNKLVIQNSVYGYLTPEYVKDAGTPVRFKQAAEEQAAGIWEQKCLNRKQKCIFLDRDGTVNRYKGLICREEQFELEEGAAQAIRMLNEEGYLAIVITNQPVVARGMCTEGDVRQIHKKMQTLLGEQGAYLDDIEFCPHHPDRGYPEEDSRYKILCECRKPAIGMIDRMVSKYNIDLDGSYMIGDTTTDIQTGINAGIKTILVLTGQAGKDKKYDARPDMTAENLLDAVLRIIGR